MNSYYGVQYSSEDLQQQQQQQQAAAQRRNEIAKSNSLYSDHQNHDCSQLDSNSEILRRDSLDEIIVRHNSDLLRVQNLSGQYGHHDTNHQSSMLDTGNGNTSLDSLNRLHYDARNSTTDFDSQAHQSSVLQMESYGALEPTMGMSSAQMSNSHEMHSQNNMNYANQLFQNHAFTSTPMDDQIDHESLRLNTFPNFPWNFGLSGMDETNNDLMMTPSMIEVSTGCDNLQSTNINASSAVSRALQISPSHKNLSITSSNMTLGQSLASFGTQPPVNDTSAYPEKETSLQSLEIPLTSWPEESPLKLSRSSISEIYCESGFDMLGALAKVTCRKNPEINLGKVDLSCAFAVSDATQYDCPIIYVSEVFERLTGYSKYEVRGQNCRFLQSPQGKMEAGSKREFVDNDSVRFLKEKILQKREAQLSLINYRKGGQPFMNLLTIIPITGEDNVTIRYFVGFQVDLVQKPTSVEGKSSSGTYIVNYSQGTLPRYLSSPSDGNMRPALQSGQTYSREDVSTVLASIKSGTESDLTKRMWDKILVENTDDVVHVLSLKGLFLYLSPSSRNVLEYDASELVGKALSAVCHPSDIVSVTRELKDTSTGTPVNVVYRIRRKQSGYTWFESHGSLCVEQGKGRKCIILVGREKPVYVLHRYDIEASGGIGENEMWNKISTSGMFLFVSSNVRNLLGRTPQELVGTSIQALMRTEAKVEFGRSLESARSGKKISCRHEILSKRGMMMQAQTTLYPGDSSEGLKATFLVAQTKLIKSSSTSVPSAMLNVSTSFSTPFNQSGFAHDKQLFRPQCSSIDVTSDCQAGATNFGMSSQHVALASESNIFDELKTTRCTSWQFELRQMEKSNRILAEELASLLSSRKKRKRRKAAGYLHKDCANCHTQVTPEWRRGPSGLRDLCNSCGLRYAKQTGRLSSRPSNRDSNRDSNSASSVQSSLPQDANRSSKAMFVSENSSNNTTVLKTPEPFENYRAKSRSTSNVERSADNCPRIAGPEPCMQVLNEMAGDNRPSKKVDMGYRVEQEKSAME